MRQGKFSTASILFWMLWAGVILAHLRLSYPAIVCRNHPPLAPNDLVALFVGPFFAFVPALFGNPTTRRLGVAVGAAGFAFIYALAYVNLNDARPSIGHLAGIPGILGTYHVFVLSATVPLYVPVVITLHFVDRVFGDLFRAVVPAAFRV